MNAKQAKQIRMGIMYMCRPILKDSPDSDYQVIDHRRLYKYQYDYIFNGTALAQKAKARTQAWDSVRYRNG